MMLVYLAIAWVAGLSLARYAGLGGYWAAVFGLAGSILLLVGRRARYKNLVVALLWVIAAGSLSYQLSLPRIDSKHLAYYNDTTGQVTLTGYVSSEPRVQGAYSQLELQVDHLTQADGTTPVRGRLAISTGAFPTYSYGQRLVITGTLLTPPIYPDFNYREYLAARGVNSVMGYPKIALAAGMGGNPVTLSLLTLNRALRKTVEAILPQPEAGLLQGILLGASDALPSDVAENFRQAGLTHILVVSGFNISIVMQMILLLAQKALRRKLAILLALAGITFFGVLVGFSAPVQRAWLMGILTMLAVLSGRKAHPLTSLALASWVMTAINPLILWSVSFQLSFVATLALIVVEPIVSKACAALAARMQIGLNAAIFSLFTTTAAAQLLTLPLIWHYFGQVSLVALAANLFVLPLQPLVLSVGAVVTAVGGISVALGRWLGYLVWPLLRYTLLVPRWLARLPLTFAQLPRMSVPAMALFYLVLCLALMALNRVRGSARMPKPASLKPWAASAILLVVAVSVWSYLFSMPAGRLRVDFLDVGQGDAILLTSPGGRTILVDGGIDGLTLRSQLGETLVLNRHQLNMIVTTHGDADHIGGLVDLPEYYSVDRVIRSPDPGSGAAVLAMQEEYNRRRIPQEELVQGALIRVGDDLALQVLHPPANSADSGNAASLVLRVSYGKFSMLLTSDIDEQVEQTLITDNLPLSAYVLKVAHHGSGTATMEAFLDRVRPSIAVISVGADNKVGHPDQGTLERLQAAGCRILRTDQLGTITLSTDGYSIVFEGD